MCHVVLLTHYVLPHSGLVEGAVPVVGALRLRHPVPVSTAMCSCFVFAVLRTCCAVMRGACGMLELQQGAGRRLELHSDPRGEHRCVR
jgi:hypothetical protein